MSTLFFMLLVDPGAAAAHPHDLRGQRTIAAVIGLGFVFLIPQIEPQLAFLRSIPLPCDVVRGRGLAAPPRRSRAAGRRSDGVRAAPFVPVENATFSILKPARRRGIARLMPTLGIFVSWTIAIAINSSSRPTKLPPLPRASRYLQKHPAYTAAPLFRDIRPM